MLAMVPMLIVPHLNPCARSWTEGGMGLLSPRASSRLAKRMSSPRGGGPVIDSGAALLPPAFDRVRRMALVHRLKELRAMRAIVYPPPGRWGEGAHTRGMRFCVVRAFDALFVSARAPLALGFHPTFCSVCMPGFGLGAMGHVVLYAASLLVTALTSVGQRGAWGQLSTGGPTARMPPFRTPHGV